MEIKAGQTITNGWFDGIRRFRTLLPQAHRGVVVHGGDGTQARQEAEAIAWRNWPAQLTALDERSVTGPGHATDPV